MTQRKAPATAESDAGRQVEYRAPVEPTVPVESTAQIPEPRSGKSNPRETLEQLAHRVRQAVHADLVAIIAEEAGGMHILGGVDGRDATGLRGLVLGPANGSRAWRELLAPGRPFMIENFAADQRLKDIPPQLSLGRLMLIPLMSSGQVMGALVLASLPNRKPFDTLDLELACVFAWPAAEALTLIGLRDVERRMDTAEGRDRIARSLHDVVLQRLFAIGLYLDRVAPSVSGSVADSLNVATTELSATINEIRATIFSLHAAAISGPTLRDELLDIAMRGCETLGFDVHLNLEGSVDRTIPTLPGHLRATLEEALTAIARQGSASRVDVLVRADHDQLSLQIHANGDLLPADDREAMLADGLRRISSLGGSLDIGSASDDHGTILAWQVPIPSEAATAG